MLLATVSHAISVPTLSARPACGEQSCRRQRQHGKALDVLRFLFGKGVGASSMRVSCYPHAHNTQHSRFLRLWRLRPPPPQPPPLPPGVTGGGGGGGAAAAADMMTEELSLQSACGSHLETRVLTGCSQSNCLEMGIFGSDLKSHSQRTELARGARESPTERPGRHWYSKRLAGITAATRNITERKGHLRVLCQGEERKRESGRV